MENYEQKYKEDLEAAKGWLAITKENNNKIAIQILENLFPELKESEDEKIRKEIVEIFKAAQRDGICEPIKKEQFEKIFDWLEKQGENKPIETPKWMIDFLDGYRTKIGSCLDYDETKEIDSNILCILEWLKGNTNIKQESYEGKDSMIREGISDEMIRKDLIKFVENHFPVSENKKWMLTWLEKQGEHAKFRESIQVGDKVIRNEAGDLVNLSQLERVAKPIEKKISPSESEEDERIRKWCISHFKDCFRVVKDNVEYQEYLNNEVIPWLEKQGEQKQLNDVSIRKLFDTYRCTEEYDENGNYKGKPVNCMVRAYEQGIKDVIKMVKQNPAWNEEYERHRKRIVERLEDIRKSKENNIDVASVILSEINWLKSIKDRIGNFDDGYKLGFSAAKHNQWKPTEQNIKDLEWCADLVKEKMGVGFHRLQVLIDELKKL